MYSNTGNVFGMGGKMENIKELLPIGSVVAVKGGLKKVMIIGLLQTIHSEEEEVRTFDYIGVIYPEGFLNLETMILFDHDLITDIVFKGYENLEREEMIQAMCDNLPENIG